MRGLITKLVGGTYTVFTDDTFYSTRARGNFRHKNISPVVGDWVTFEDGYILDIDERDNELVRPPIANVDQVLLVFSAVEPEISTILLDRLLTIVTLHGIEAVIIITKMDLATDHQKDEIYHMMKYYNDYFRVHFTKSKEFHNFESYELFEGKITVLAGQSGVGKSTLINAMTGLEIDTQAISKALGRGKHTTRHSELIPFEGGWIADTPGFSALDFSVYQKEDVRDSFPDFVEKSHNCKFRGCMHVAEPGCKVKEELSNILESRYQNYLQIMKDVEENKKY